MPEFPIGRLPKALNFSEDAHVLKVSTFESESIFWTLALIANCYVTVCRREAFVVSMSKKDL